MDHPMSANAIAYNVTFRDFQFLQGHMTRRVFARNRQKYGPALLGVALCAFFLAMVMVLNVNPYRAAALFGGGLRYPLSFYLLVILCLVAAIVCLIPAIKLRLNSLRLQVSDDGPLLGSTELIIEPDGLVIDRRVVKSKYLWAAFQGIEILKNAVILPIDNGIGIIIPASAFSSDAERYDFAAVISKRLEEQGR
jgi:YcxB-like protein